VITSTFQDMMAGIDNISVDFAYLQLERIIGHGATSEVYCGRYKKKLVAIKLSNPPEVTEEAIDVFVAEAKIAASLNHTNIVQFVGICVRPPQIAMVFEFCEGGNLKSNLQKNPDKWTPVRRLNACVDCCRAMEAFHHLGLIHRDLKAENFFVGRKQVVKLGDFGESTHARTVESTASRRMTILGTVAFMAPELIAAKRHYTEAIDIYALSITMWEIWTGKDPYEDISQFDIYAKVATGYRPALPADSPPGFNDALAAAWQEDPNLRPSAGDLLNILEDVYQAFTAGQSVPDMVDEEEEQEKTKTVSKDTVTTSDSAGDIESQGSRALGTGPAARTSAGAGAGISTGEEEVNPIHTRVVAGSLSTSIPTHPAPTAARAAAIVSGSQGSSWGSSRPTSGASTISDIELATITTPALDKAQ
jgi:serine/threonine protein kinase